MELIVIENRADLITAVTERTQKERALKEAAAPSPAAEPSRLVKDLQSVYSKSDLSSHMPNFGDLLSALVLAIEGTEVEFKKAETDILYDYKKLTLVVPLPEHIGMGGSSYKTPFIVLDKGSNGQASGAITTSGGGNTHHGTWRYATDEELKTFFEELPSKYIDSILSRYSE